MPGGFSGNGSVEWFVDVDNAKEDPTCDKKPDNPKGWIQHGTDDWGDKLYDFFVTIMVPKNDTARENLADDLKKAEELVRGNKGKSFQLRFPVEDVKRSEGRTDDQILVHWREAGTGPPPQRKEFELVRNLVKGPATA